METQEQYQQLLSNMKSLEKSVQRLFREMRNSRTESKYLNVKETCDFLGISKSSLYRLMRSREISFTAVGGCRKFLRSELEEYVKMNRTYSISNVIEGLK